MSNLSGFPLDSKNEMLRFAQHDDKGADSCAGKASSCYIIGISRLPLRGLLEMTVGEEEPPRYCHCEEPVRATWQSPCG